MPLPILRRKDLAHQQRFQLWTDALTFRQMAKEAPSHYLRSMCVRNALLSAWTSLEMACCDALGIQKLESDFKRSLDDGFASKGFAALDFGSGIWQEINGKVKGYRKLYTHFGVSLVDRFPSVSIAEHAITKIREAIGDIYTKTGKEIPAWVNLDASSGWPQTGGIRMSAHLTLLRGPINKNDPNVFNISLVTPSGEEKETTWLPANTPEEDIMDEVERLLGCLNAPFKEVRVYRGPELFYQEDLDMRGI